jgi:hypothetical protein
MAFFFNFALGLDRTLDPRVSEPKQTPLGYILLKQYTYTGCFRS